jgi:AAA+ ATPase superfamily predicted ATPase
VPVTETQPHKSRRGIYRIKDNFLRFWFRFVLPNWSQLERGAKSVVWESAIVPELDHFSAPIFEQVCQQYFWREGLAGRLPFVPEKVGSWWQANQEIDLVLLGSGNVMLVECKWASRPVGIDIFEELVGKTTSMLHETGKQKITYALCSRSGFTKQLEELAAKQKAIQLLNWTGMVSG